MMRDCPGHRSMGRRRWALASSRTACLLLVATLVGCFSPRKDERRYHTLPLPSAGKTRGTAAWPGVVYVPVFDISATHDRAGLALRSSEVTLRYSARHLWAHRPHRLVSDRVAGWLERRRTFDGVVGDLGELAPRWVLRGRVEALEVQTAGVWKVRLGLRVVIREYDTGKRVWSKLWVKERQVGSNDPEGAVRALSALFRSVLSELDAGLASAAPGR